MRWPTSRTTTPALISASATADTAAPSTPSATRMATLRVATPPSPGLAVSDSVGDTSTSGLGGSAMARGKGSGKAMPNWSATAMASSSDTLRSDATMRCRIAGTVSLLSSKAKALMMCCCSQSVWLLKNSVAWL
ncbi:hypothetical protein G6F22_020130 [Rhizopus arrhizus]|nr:hypothetical protein G6F22_020130 [Rhizopus arrhizus]